MTSPSDLLLNAERALRRISAHMPPIPEARSARWNGRRSMERGKVGFAVRWIAERSDQRRNGPDGLSWQPSSDAWNAWRSKATE